jgi:hypothetical protein
LLHAEPKGRPAAQGLLHRVRAAAAALVAISGLAACAATTTYRPDYVNAALAPQGEQIAGKVLIYMPASDEQYILTSSASTFTGSGAKLSVPVGLMTREIARTVYGGAFTEGAEFRNEIGDCSGFRAVIQPRVADFKYFYHQLENAGFAVTPGVQLTFDLNLLDAQGTMSAHKTYARPEQKAGSYFADLDPEERISRLAHEELARAMTGSLDDLKGWLATQAPH